MAEIQADKTKFETLRAFLIVIDGEEIWLPKFAKDGTELVIRKDNDRYSMPDWLAVEKGLEDYVE